MRSGLRRASHARLPTIAPPIMATAPAIPSCGPGKAARDEMSTACTSTHRPRMNHAGTSTTSTPATTGTRVSTRERGNIRK